MADTRGGRRPRSRSRRTGGAGSPCSRRGRSHKSAPSRPASGGTPARWCGCAVALISGWKSPGSSAFGCLEQGSGAVTAFLFSRVAPPACHCHHSTRSRISHRADMATVARSKPDSPGSSVTDGDRTPTTLRTKRTPNAGSVSVNRRHCGAKRRARNTQFWLVPSLHLASSRRALEALTRVRTYSVRRPTRSPA
jgi:hypothetical protein